MGFLLLSYSLAYLLERRLFTRLFTRFHRTALQRRVDTVMTLQPSGTVPICNRPAPSRLILIPVKVVRNPCTPRALPRTHTTTTALHVLGMPRHCTGVITGVAAAHGWPGWPCSARVPELQLVSDGSLQRRRTPTALQEGR